ncbi:MAG: PIG-L family deacetylase, partial [Acidobacteria bacterium]|nr:PIG-L family deacetylase [Acidobacteriota bacterium]
GSALARPGPSVSYYKLLASKVGMAEKETSFLERLDASLSSYADVFRHVEAAVRSFSAANPQACVPALTAGLEAVRHLRRTNRDPDLQTKEDQFLTALEQALGLSFDVLVEPEHLPADPFAQFRPWETFALATPGQTFRSATFFHSSGRAGIKVKDVELMTPPGWSWRRLGENRFEVAVAAEAPATMAYWRRGSIRENLYQIDEPRWFRWPLPPAPVRARLTYFVNGVEASMDREAETSYVDHIGVEHHRALAVGPAVSVRFTSDAGVLPLGQREYSIGCVVRNNFNGLVKGTVWLSLPVGWQSEPGSTPFDFEREKEEANISFRLTAPQGLEAKEYPIEAVASFQGRAYRSSFTAITQPGLETVYLSKPARRQVRGVDVKVAKGMRVGYVMGTGDEVPEGLRQLALPVDLLDSAALPTGDLSRYNTILLGIRAYAARPDVKTYNPRLLEYVRQGGVLIVQYNTQEYDHNYGPFPYTMGANAEEISEEDSPVEILEPSDPVFRFPNRITARDFDGWVEQRGSKFWTTWDAAYRPLLSTHDRGQAPQRGGWLVARHDKGLYIYCAYAWYRQLPFAVPGAFRLFANLVSLGAADAPWRK